MAKVQTFVSRKQFAPTNYQAKTAHHPIQRSMVSTLQQAVDRPDLAKPETLRDLSHQSGNRAVTGLIQAKLMVGPAQDRYEREADQVASSVMSGLATTQPAALQRDEERSIQRLPALESSGTGFAVSPQIESILAAQRGSGLPLPEDLRSAMEPRFGANFSNVRLHSGSQAASLAHSIQAKAFTYGSDIYLGEGAYNPATQDGRRLLAHELTHVVQQGGGSPASGIQQSPEMVQGVWYNPRTWGKKKETPPTTQAEQPSQTETKPSTDTTTDTPKPETEESTQEPKQGEEQPPEGQKPVISGPTDVKTNQFEGPSVETSVIKPGKQGEETAEHNVDSYRNIIWDYVKQVQLDQANVEQQAGILHADYDDVHEGRIKYDNLDEKEKSLTKLLSDKSALEQNKETKKEISKLTSGLKEVSKGKKNLLEALHEKEFPTAEKDARKRKEDSATMAYDCEQEKTTVEYCYDEIERIREELSKAKSSLSRKEKKDPSMMAIIERGEKDAANRAKTLTQQAKLSFQFVSVRRAQVQVMFDHVKKTLNRIPGAVRKIAGKIFAAILNVGLNILTLGFFEVKGKTNTKGYLGSGLEKEGNFKVQTVFDSIADKWKELKKNLRQRPDGPTVMDWISTILRGINEIFFQPIMNIASKVALVSGLLCLIPGAAAGFAPIAAVASMIALVAGLCKVGVDILRMSFDGITALANRDAKLQNILTGRFSQTSLETVSDVVTTTGSALGPGVKMSVSGSSFVNPLSYSGMTAYQTASSTLGGKVAGISVSTGAPILAGPVLTGGVQAGHETSGFYGTEGGSTLKAKSNVIKLGSMVTPRGNEKSVPDWMKKERQKEEKLRAQVAKAKLTEALRKLENLKGKSSTLTGHFTKGTNDAIKGDSQVTTAQKSNVEGVTSEEVDGSKSTKGLLQTGKETAVDWDQALVHARTKVQKMALEYERMIAQKK
ncbi:MAG TPA: DUF4157 domain-containing protein [Anaerolineaceae bacterium]